MHSCGAIQPVVDDLVERGLNVLNPLQVSAGLDVVDRALRSWGVPMEGVRLADGSGLSNENRLTCAALLAVLLDPVVPERETVSGPLLVIADVSPSVGAEGIEAARRYLDAAPVPYELVAAGAAPRAVAMTHAPPHFASFTASRPTVPAPPWMSTLRPATAPLPKTT